MLYSQTSTLDYTTTEHVCLIKLIDNSTPDISATVSPMLPSLGDDLSSVILPRSRKLGGHWPCDYNIYMVVNRRAITFYATITQSLSANYSCPRPNILRTNQQLGLFDERVSSGLKMLLKWQYLIDRMKASRVVEGLLLLWEENYHTK